MSYTLSRLEVLELALEGAKTRRGTAQGLTPAEWREHDRTVAELERRVRKARADEDHRESTMAPRMGAS